MMEWEPVYRVAALGLVIGILFGAIANKTQVILFNICQAAVVIKLLHA